MKQKTSVSLSPEALALLDAMIEPGGNRSQLIEQAIFDLAERRRRRVRDERDKAIFQRDAELMNAEMAEILEFQFD